MGAGGGRVAPGLPRPALTARDPGPVFPNALGAFICLQLVSPRTLGSFALTPVDPLD